MSKNFSHEGKFRGNNLTLPKTASGFEDEFEGLSVIEVTPRSEPNSKMRALASNTLESRDEPSGRSTLVSASSDSSFSLSATSNSGKLQLPVKQENAIPHSVSTFLSSITRGWSKSSAGEGQKVQAAEAIHSPSSVLVRKDSNRSGSNLLGLGQEKEKELLKRPIFGSIDGPDAQEFQDFLEEDGGESHRIPVLCLVDYGGVGAYAADVFVLMHNTIRRELFDVFEIVKVVRQEYLSMTVDDVYNLRKWWRFFNILWSEYVSYEKTQLNPIIQQICLVDGRSDVLLKRLCPLREMREWLGLKMEEITSYIEEFEKLPPGRALCLVCKTIDSFADRAMNYFSGQERILPPFVENYHREEIKLSVECKLVDQMRKSAYFPELVVSLVRWMGTVQGFTSPRTQSKEREKWLNTHLFWMERQNLSKYYQKYEASHGRVLSHFRNRLQNSDSL